MFSIIQPSFKLKTKPFYIHIPHIYLGLGFEFEFGLQRIKDLIFGLGVRNPCVGISLQSPQSATTPKVLTLQKGIGLNFAQNVIMIMKNHLLKQCFWIISKRRKKLWANNILVNIYLSPSKLSRF